MNSLWGKFCQISEAVETKIVSDVDEFFRIAFDPTSELYDVLPLTEKHMLMTFKTLRDCVVENPNSNVALGMFCKSWKNSNLLISAAYVTAYGRLALYDLLEPVADRAIYHDTDSLIYAWQPGQFRHKNGMFLGDLTNELRKNERLTEFVCIG